MLSIALSSVPLRILLLKLFNYLNLPFSPQF